MLSLGFLDRYTSKYMNIMNMLLYAQQTPNQQPSITPEEQLELSRRLAEINTQISAKNQELFALFPELFQALNDSEKLQALETQISRIQQELAALQQERDEIISQLNQRQSNYYGGYSNYPNIFGNAYGGALPNLGTLA